MVKSSVELPRKLSHNQSTIEEVMRFEQFSPEKHYETIRSWWDFYKWPDFSLKVLPKWGIITYHENKPSCACWLYETDSSLCMAESLVSNPEIAKKHRGKIIDKTIERCLDYAKSLGYEVMYAAISIPALSNRLDKYGFVAGKKNLNMFKVL